MYWIFDTTVRISLCINALIKAYLLQTPPLLVVDTL